MDLNTIKFNSSNSNLSNNIQKYYINNRLCIVYGELGHWKNAYNPNINLNPLLILQRQPPFSRGGFFNKGNSN